MVTKTLIGSVNLMKVKRKPKCKVRLLFNVSGLAGIGIHFY